MHRARAYYRVWRMKRTGRRLNKKRLRQFVLDYCNGRVWTTADIPQELWATCFLPLTVFADEERVPEMLKRPDVRWYGHVKDSLPRTVNGFPMFMAVSPLTGKEWTKTTRAIKREIARRGKLKV